MKPILLWSVAAAMTLVSCKKNDAVDYDTSIKAPLSVEFDNIAGSSDLHLNTAVYTNSAGENFTVTALKYYVSNFKFTNVNGSVYTVPQDSSYFLIEEGVEDEVELNIPEGEYRSVSFVLGVDSLRSTMDISKRTDVLDPSAGGAGMYQDQNNGYYFYVLEGTSPSIVATDPKFSYHIGGYGGMLTPTANNLKTITLDLTARGTPKVKQGKETNIHLMVDVLKALTGNTTTSFAATPIIDSPAAAVAVANNYASMFRHDHTEN